MKKISNFLSKIILLSITTLSYSANSEVCAELHVDIAHRGDSRIIFTTDNYQPQYLGEAWDNVVSSLRVADGCTITLYDYLYDTLNIGIKNGYGYSITLDHSTPFLYNFNDKASYFICTCSSEIPIFFPPIN